MDNRAKPDNKNLDFMPFIQNEINGHIEWEYSIFSGKWLIFKAYSLLKWATETKWVKISKK